MKRILCTFLMVLLTVTVCAQDDNVLRPPKKPVKQQQQVIRGSGQPSKPNKPTAPTKPINPINQPSEPINLSKPATSPTELPVPSKPILQSSVVLDSVPILEPIPPSKPITPLPTTATVNGYEWVDLGLSVKWATKNVGADSPSDYGSYYVWGETSTKSSYDWDNCFDCIKPKKWDKDSSWGIYRRKDGQSKVLPHSGHDTARENWGGTWRMPTEAEYDELCKRCRWTWTKQNGHYGYAVTGPNGNCIFLPAAGFCFGSGMYGLSVVGYYWTSTLSSMRSCYACLLNFDASSYVAESIDARSHGHSIRPVTE